MRGRPFFQCASGDGSGGHCHRSTPFPPGATASLSCQGERWGIFLFTGRELHCAMRGVERAARIEPAAPELFRCTGPNSINT